MKNIVKNWRKWLLAWAFPIAVMAQGGQTTYQTVWTNQGQTGYSTAVSLRQIGQSGHLVNVYFSNVDGQDCGTVTGETMQFFLEGSFNNSSWFVIRSSFYIFGTIDAAGNIATQIDGYGSYPYYRVRALWYAGGGVANIFAKCKMSGWYGGTVNGTRQPTDRLQTNQDVYSRYGGSVTSATTTTLVSSAGAHNEITVWDLTVCADGAQVATFQDSTPISIYRLAFSASGGCIHVPYVGLYHMGTDYGKNLQLVTTTAARTTYQIKVLRDQ